MKYWRGYLTAAIFAVITWAVLAFGRRFTVLVDMVYPYVMRTGQTMLAEWSSGVSFNLWQLLLAALITVGLATLVLMIVLKWSPVQWLGWVLAVCSGVYMCNTLLFGLNYYAGSLAEDIRMEVVEYNVEELTEAAIYYRDKANALAPKVNRDDAGHASFADFDTLATQAGEGFQTLTYEYSYSVFAGSTLPVKPLAWADMFTDRGITGVTVALTGEASVNPQIPDVCLPFTMCHEMSHRMCIATESDANMAAFLACQANSSLEFQYSAYFMAYRYCYNALVRDGSPEASAAAARVNTGVSDLLYQDLVHVDQFFTDHGGKSVGAAPAAAAAQEKRSFGPVCDLLVSWHIQEIVLPSISQEESRFDPFDESQVDLSGIVNALPDPTEETEPDE